MGGCEELNLGPLGEQCVFLTTELLFQSLCWLVFVNLHKPWKKEPRFKTVSSRLAYVPVLIAKI